MKQSKENVVKLLSTLASAGGGGGGGHILRQQIFTQMIDQHFQELWLLKSIYNFVVLKTCMKFYE